MDFVWLAENKLKELKRSGAKQSALQLLHKLIATPQPYRSKVASREFQAVFRRSRTTRAKLPQQVTKRFCLRIPAVHEVTGSVPSNTEAESRQEHHDPDRSLSLTTPSIVGSHFCHPCDMESSRIL